MKDVNEDVSKKIAALEEQIGALDVALQQSFSAERDLLKVKQNLHKQSKRSESIYLFMMNSNEISDPDLVIENFMSLFHGHFIIDCGICFKYDDAMGALFPFFATNIDAKKIVLDVGHLKLKIPFHELKNIDEVTFYDGSKIDGKLHQYVCEVAGSVLKLPDEISSRSMVIYCFFSSKTNELLVLAFIGAKTVAISENDSKIKNSDYSFFQLMGKSFLQIYEGKIVYNNLLGMTEHLMIDLKQKRVQLDESETNLTATVKELQRMQKRLIENEKMAVLGEMASGIAHEINNPLAILMTLMKLMSKELSMKQYSQKFQEKQADLINQATATIWRISAIVKGLKYFSRNDDDDPFKEENIIEIIEDTLTLVNDKFKTNGIAVIKEYDEAAKISLNIKRVMLSQVIVNLLNNSFDEINGMESPWVKITVSRDDESTMLSISDSGSGLPLEIQEKVFQPFFTTKEVGKGTGLGLSISKGIVELHKGELYINKSNANTEFVIKLRNNL